METTIYNPLNFKLNKNEIELLTENIIKNSNKVK